MLCCSCSKWVLFRCSLFSKFKTLDSFHSWSCSPCCVPVSFGGLTPTNTVSCSSSSSLHTSTVQPGTFGSSSANLVLPPHPSSSNILTIFCSLHISFFFTIPYPACFWLLSSSSPDSLRVLQWNARVLPNRSAKLLHFISFHFVDLCCIQESNFNSSFS